MKKSSLFIALLTATLTLASCNQTPSTTSDTSGDKQITPLTSAGEIHPDLSNSGDPKSSAALQSQGLWVDFNRYGSCTYNGYDGYFTIGYGYHTCGFTRAYQNVSSVQIYAGSTGNIIFWRRPQIVSGNINLSKNPGVSIGFNWGATHWCDRSSWNADKRAPCVNPWPDLEVDVGIDAWQKGIPAYFVINKR